MPPAEGRGEMVAGPDAGSGKGVIAMRKTLWVTCVVLVAAAMIAGCGAKKNEQAAVSSSDSLLASNPSEPASGKDRKSVV